jgi:hypothetical protein
MKTESEINKSIAYIQDGTAFFQVLNESGDDWDELATRQAYENWKNQ